jgi:hypothetical protein
MMNAPNQILFGNQIKKNKMSVTCATYGERKASFRVLMGRSKGKRQCERPRCTWEEHTEVGFKGMGWGGMDQIDLA